MQMITFDLFDSIEDSAVQLQPHRGVDMRNIEKMTLERVNAKEPAPARRRRSLGVYLLAAVLVTFLLATTVFAYVGFTQYENPAQMLRTFFGNNELLSGESTEAERFYEDGTTYTVELPANERVPLDEDLAEEAAPPISAVGQSITFQGTNLTIVSHQHDAALGAGTICFTLENPEGVTGYETQFDGEIYWPDGDPIKITRCGAKSYIIPSGTTDTKLSIACYYVGTLWRAEWQENPYIKIQLRGSEASLELPLDIFAPVESLTCNNGEVTLTSIGLNLQLQNMEFLYFPLENGNLVPPRDTADIGYLAIRFTDGTEYVVEKSTDGELIENVSYVAGYYDSDKGALASYLFNRIIDLEKVEAVIINDTEFILS